jgi:hypothetical protein
MSHLVPLLEFNHSETLLCGDRRNVTFFAPCSDMSIIPHMLPSRPETRKGWVPDHWQLDPP